MRDSIGDADRSRFPRTKVLGIDIGGSAVKGAPVDTETGLLLAARHRIVVDRTTSPAKIAAAVRDVAAHFEWRGPIGIGFPGVIEGATIRTSANLHPKFIDCDGANLFGHATGCPVALINDTAAAALAEMRFGAGRRFMGKTLLLTLGTGVGSALAYQGVVVPLELGHFPWRHGRAAEKYVAASVRKKKDLSWRQWGARLHEFVAVLESLFWPERIIVGGGVSAKHEQFFGFIHSRAKLVPAQFRNGAGIAGAAMWAVDGDTASANARRHRSAP